jgi:hypothetical protein
MEVGLLSQKDDVAASSIPIRSITERLSLFPSSFTRQVIGSPGVWGPKSRSAADSSLKQPVDNRGGALQVPDIQQSVMAFPCLY